MIRNLKVIGFAAMAALVVSGIGATGAQAASFSAASTPVTLVTTSDGTGKTAHQVLDFAGAGLTCSNVSGSATQNTSPVAEFQTASISYSGCNYVGQATTINMNGCNYNFQATGVIDIRCPEGREITWSVPNPVCDVVFPAQPNIGTVTYHNIETAGSKEITVSQNLTGLDYTATGAGCPETGTFGNGALTTGNVIFTGQDHSGNTIDIEWNK